LAKIWAFIIIISIFYGLATNRSGDLTSALLSIPEDALKVSFTMVSAACFWSGFLYIMKDAGIIDMISLALQPILKFIFPKLNDKEAMNYISMNVAANLLGLGSAATPSGLMAMKRLQEVSPNNKDVASNDMVTFLVLNTAGLTIIPTTVMAIRKSLGSVNPADFIFVGLLASAASTFIGLIVERLLRQVFKHG
jgi:spore maturation protein A